MPLAANSRGRFYMDRAYGSLSMFMVYANGLKSVVIISSEATPLAATRLQIPAAGFIWAGPMANELKSVAIISSEAEPFAAIECLSFSVTGHTCLLFR